MTQFRWGTLQQCFHSLLDSEALLYSIVTERDFVSGPSRQQQERGRIQAIITNPLFIETLKKSIAILSPIDKLIVKYQSDSVPISEVLFDFTYTLIVSFTELKATIITEMEYQYLISITKQRYDFLYGDAHGFGYLLDPRFVGEKLSAELRSSLEDKLFDMKVSTADGEEAKVLLFLQYTEFLISARAEKANNSFRYEMLTKNVNTPHQYWLADGAQWPQLQQIGLKVFSLATSSASVERSFSTQAFIHSKLRNSLSAEKVEKLVYIRTNHTEQQADKGFLQEMCDSSEEDQTMEAE
jgi:hypothetical protein